MRHALAGALSLTILLPAALAPALVTQASAEVSKQHLGYLERWTVGHTSQTVIQNLGAPDFVILPTDKDEAGQDLREFGIARQLVWSVKGCQPVKMDFDTQGRSTGVDYSAFAQGGKHCMAELATLLTPSPSHSCKLESRKVSCR